MWLTLGVAGLVIIFGLYRILMVFRSSDEEARARERKGMFGLAGRTHFLIGVIYLLLGGALVATTFGWNPLAGTFVTKPESDAPAKSGKSIPVAPPSAPAPSGAGGAATPAPAAAPDPAATPDPAAPAGAAPGGAAPGAAAPAK